MSNYPNLFKPKKINSIYLKNRIIAAPMGGGFVDKHKIENLAQKSRGGAAVVVIGSCSVDNDRSLIAPNWGGLFEPYMEKFMDQLNVIHQYGAKASIEIMHCGIWADVAHLGKNPFGPVSMIRNIGKDADGVQVDAMTEKDMQEVSDNFAKSALSAKKLGFDIVMLHFAHGWLPAQFLSPKFNKREDEYGGSFENRIRFPMMIVDKVRKAVGPDYPLDMRISGDERCSDGIDPDEVVKFVKRIEDKIDMIHVSSGIDKYMDLTTYVESPQLYPHMINVHLAAKMKEAVSIPVTTVGGITTPDEAEQILAEGKADFVAMARPLLADPDWPKKAMQGNGEDIVPCLRCLSCYHVATECFTHGCSVNPVFTREERLKLDMMEKREPKNVVVVGGGPAGLKAAITAADYGHKVTLLEKEAKLGGLLKYADLESQKIDLKNYKDYLVTQANKKDIDIKLGTEATPEMVKEIFPDELIVAIGSVPNKPPIEGVDLPHVIQALDLYGKEDKAGDNVVIIGGGEIGAEMSLSLADMGKKVKIIEMTDGLLPVSNLMYKAAFNILMNEREYISFETGTVCKKITQSEVICIGKYGEEKEFKADTVIIATGMKALKEKADAFYGIVPDVKIIGDCVRPRKVDDATYEGFFAVTSIR